jgi:hypothetical protein
MKLILKAGLLAAALTLVVGAPAQALISGVVTSPGNKCLAGKIKCVVGKKSCILGCYAKATKTAGAPDPACVDKCKNKFDGGATPAKGCFEKLEAKGGCLTEDDTRGMEAKIDGFIEEITDALGAPGTVATGKCLAGKIKNVIGYNKCVLGVFGKAAGGGLAADSAKLQKCIDKINAAYAKLEAKPPCATTGDVADIKRADDLFIDDVLAELGGDMDTQRCNGDTSVTCTTAPGGLCVSGTCEHFFGAPLPLSAGGVATCVVSQWDGGISGTANQQTGASVGNAGVLSRVYLAASVDQPCPKCVNDGLPNDGVSGGTCSGGARNGLACDSNGISPNPAFGATSHDCPPNGGTLVGSLPVDLSNTNNGVAAITLSASSPNCNGAPGKKCACGVCSLDTTVPCRDNTDCPGLGTCGFTAGSPASPNACIDDTAVPGDGTLCAATGGGEGSCTEGPIDQNCVIQTHKGCITDADCNAVAGDTCGSKNRECFLDNGLVGGQVAATGSTTVPERNASRPTFASAFCIAPTGSAAVNNVAGLPGPGRLQLGGVAAEDGTGTTCPTQFTFLPTSKGGVLDTGWTGISHDATVVSGGKVTVQVTGCAGAAPNCGECTYTGPVANPNVN